MIARRFLQAAAAFLLMLLGVSPAFATLAISSKPTKNMDCSAGECIATDADAVMNVDDLAALLATSDMRVVTDGVFFQDIAVLAPLSWASAHALSLESNDAIFLRSTITVQGTAHLTFKVDGGPIFQRHGAVHFWDTASGLTIDGQDYRLVGSIADLAAAVAASAA